ncbi:DUF1700 domain-containing protein [Enterococcus hirae]|nr:DUF1700 domain-containing protein [Enterococcus hirae]
MNREHYLTELGIYLRPLPAQIQIEILHSYEDLFEKEIAKGKSEFEVSQELGSPQAAAEKLLAEFAVEPQEKKIYPGGWEEIEKEPLQTSDDEAPVPESYPNPPKQHSLLKRLLLFFLALCLDIFLVVWLFLALFAMIFGGWVLCLTFLFFPLLIFLPLFHLGPLGLGFEGFLCLLLGGLAILGILILIPITKYSLVLLKNYLLWHLRLLGGNNR